MTARIPLALALLALLAAGCGGNGDPAPEPSAGTGQGTTAEETTAGAEPPADTGEAPAGGRTYEVWLADRGYLRLGWRPGPSTEAVAAESLDILLGEVGLTEIPAGTTVLGVDVDGDAARVDLSAEFGREGPRLRVGQVVFTVTQFDNVRSVEVLAEGEPLADLPGRHTRETFEDDLAPIVVESPTGLEPVSGSIRVSGTANVFEANVQISVRGDLGQELASTFATATCGTGCRGDFETTVEVSVPAETGGTLLLSEEDASGGEEGRPPYTIEIPIVIRP